VPSQEVVSARNRQAAAQAGSAPREGEDKVWDVGKDAGVGALGGAAVGAGGGTLYGMWDNKKNDERFREAYASGMHARGYTG
jgi:hypothetical protein